MRKVILIGGAPTIGKSHLARKLAEELQLPWISTDTIREQMRKIVRKEDYPSLFLHSEATSDLAVEFLTHNTAEEIVHHQNRESEDVWKGVKALIETDYVWQEFIVEGIAILPNFVSQLEHDKESIKPVFLFDDNEKRIREVVFTRGLWDDAEKYPDTVKVKEIKWVLKFNMWLKKECERFGFPIVKVGDRSFYIKEIKHLIE